MAKRRYFLAGSEIAFGVPSGTPTHWFRVLEDSLRSDQGHIYPEDIERADDTVEIPGPYKVGGDIGGYAEPYYFGFLLERALGKWSGSTVLVPGEVYRHSIITTESDVEYFYVEKGLQELNSAIRYGGVKIENFRLESRMGQPLMWTASIRSFKDSLVAQVVDATVEAGYDSVQQPFMHHNISITHGTDTLKIQTFQLNIRNKFTDAYYSSRFSSEWDFEGREISGSLTLKNVEINMLEKFFGADNLKRPAQTITSYAISATYTSAPIYTGGLYGQITVHIPRVYLDTEQLQGRGRATETIELPFRALWDRTVHYAIVATFMTSHGKPL